MRLRWLCNHRYIVAGTSRGENLLGGVTYAVKFQCVDCLKVKRDIGYGSKASAERAAERYAARMGRGNRGTGA